MNSIAFISTLGLSVLLAASGCAAVEDDHKSHHSAVSSSVSKESESALSQDMDGKMDSQMKSMRAIHEKMMRATSTDERKKLMAEHSKAMQDGMAMMRNMPMMDEHSDHGDMKTMHDMGAMKCDMKDEMSCCKKDGSKLTTKDAMKCDMKDGAIANPHAKHQMMEKRMAMMETMMQMMMDRMINDDYDEHQASVKK
jgi:hypothetical protein